MLVYQRSFYVAEHRLSAAATGDRAGAVESQIAARRDGTRSRTSVSDSQVRVRVCPMGAVSAKRDHAGPTCIMMGNTRKLAARGKQNLATHLDANCGRACRDVAVPRDRSGVALVRHAGSTFGPSDATRAWHGLGNLDPEVPGDGQHPASDIATPSAARALPWSPYHTVELSRKSSTGGFRSWRRRV